MVSPQAEDGHIDIAHGIAEQMAKTEFCSSENRCIWVIWRKTWGWHKKTARITLSEWEKRTKLKKQHIWRALTRLELRQIITKNGKNEYAFQKDYDKWLSPITDFFTKNGNAYFYTKNGNAYTKNGNAYTKIGKNEFSKVAKEKRQRTSKETLKRNSLKENKPSCRNSEICDELRLKMEALILRNKPDYRFRGGKDRESKWNDEFRLIIEQDKRKPDRIVAVMEWALNNPFWRANILSPHKLRIQFDALELRMRSEKQEGKHGADRQRGKTGAREGWEESDKYRGLYRK